MSEAITQAVRSKYGSVATGGLSCAHEGVREVAQAFGYSPEDLASIPAEANMGLSCGNPTAFASLKPGEVVVDLGSGGGGNKKGGEQSSPPLAEQKGHYFFLAGAS